MTNADPTSTSLPAAGWWRRFLSFIYELLLTGAVILVLSGLYQGMFQLLTGQAVTTLSGNKVAQALHFAWLFTLTGAYFVFCWSRSGQTLAMKTWRLQLLGKDGSRANIRQCLIRYIVACLCYLPALPCWLLARHSTTWQALAWIATSLIILPWLWAWLRIDRQLLQDSLAGTIIRQKPFRGKETGS